MCLYLIKYDDANLWSNEFWTQLQNYTTLALRWIACTKMRATNRDQSCNNRKNTDDNEDTAPIYTMCILFGNEKKKNNNLSENRKNLRFTMAIIVGRLDIYLRKYRITRRRRRPFGPKIVVGAGSCVSVYCMIHSNNESLTSEKISFARKRRESVISKKKTKFVHLYICCVRPSPVPTIPRFTRSR